MYGYSSFWYLDWTKWDYMENESYRTIKEDEGEYEPEETAEDFEPKGAYAD